MNDAQFLAYPPVVAAGNNANVIHYINNTQVAKDNEMVLMDAGLSQNSLIKLSIRSINSNSGNSAQLTKSPSTTTPN